MNAHTDLIDRYFDAWNETDAVRRRELIAATWTADADYRDPLLAGAGHDGIDAMIRAVHERFPHHTFHRTTEVDGFANRLRFSWELPRRPARRSSRDPTSACSMRTAACRR